MPTLALVAACSGEAPAPSSTAGDGVSLEVAPAPEQVRGVLTKTAAPSPFGSVPGRFPGFGVPAYQGGTIITGSTLYLQPVFYGSTWQSGYQAKILSFLQGLAHTTYWDVLQSYTDKNGNTPPAAIDVLQAIYVTSYTHGTTLTNFVGGNSVGQLLEDVVGSGGWPVVPAQTVYLIFTDDNVTASDTMVGTLCTDFMGWHWAEQVQWTDLLPQHHVVNQPYAFIGSPQFCVNHPGLRDVDAGGSFEWDTSINGKVIDQAVTAAMHEAAEAVTDPYPPGNPFGAAGWSPEVGDICAWVPGPSTLVGGKYSDVGGGEPYTNPKLAGYTYNNGANYLVQTLWDPAQNACAYGRTWADVIPIGVACSGYECGFASNGNGGSYTCGTCDQGQTCSAHQCTGGKTCSTPRLCCIENGGVWVNNKCNYI